MKIIFKYMVALCLASFVFSQVAISYDLDVNEDDLLEYNLQDNNPNLSDLEGIEFSVDGDGPTNDDTFGLTSAGQLTYQATQHFNGDDQFGYCVSWIDTDEGEIEDCDTVSITIDPQPDDPFLVVGNEIEDESWDETDANITDFIDITGVFDDPDLYYEDVGENLSYTINVSNEDLFNSDPFVAGGVAIVLEFAADENGVSNVEIIVHDADGGATASDQFMVTINSTPDEIEVITDGIPDQMVDEVEVDTDVTFDLYDAFYDPDHSVGADIEDLSFEIDEDQDLDTNKFTTEIINNILEVTYKEDENTCEADCMTIWAYDTQGHDEEYELCFSITPQNDLVDTVDFDTVDFDESTIQQCEPIIDLNNYFSDVDTDDCADNEQTLLFSIHDNEVLNDEYFEVTLSGSNLEVCALANQNTCQTECMTILADDGNSEDPAEVEFCYNINYDDSDPYVEVVNEIPDQLRSETDSDINIVIDLSDVFTDDDIGEGCVEEELSYLEDDIEYCTGGGSNQNTNLFSVDPSISGDMLSMTVAANYNGECNIVVKAQDIGGTIASDEFMVTINQTNDPPQAIINDPSETDDNDGTIVTVIPDGSSVTPPITLQGIQSYDIDTDPTINSDDNLQSLDYTWFDITNGGSTELGSSFSQNISNLNADVYEYKLEVQDVGPGVSGGDLPADDTIEVRAVQPRIYVIDSSGNPTDHYFTINENQTINLRYTENSQSSALQDEDLIRFVIPSNQTSAFEFNQPNSSGLSILDSDNNYSVNFHNSSSNYIEFQVTGASADGFVENGFNFEATGISVLSTSTGTSSGINLELYITSQNQHLNDMSANDLANLDVSDENINIGIPTLEFANDQTFVCEDIVYNSNILELGDLFYSETGGAGSASEQNSIRIHIPDGIIINSSPTLSVWWHTLSISSGDITDVSGSSPSSKIDFDGIEISNNTIEIPLTGALNGGDVFRISNLEIQIQDALNCDSGPSAIDPFNLHLQVNNDDITSGVSPYEHITSNNIRMGQPRISIASDQILSLNDLDLIVPLDPVTYTQGQVGVATEEDNIVISIPSGTAFNYTTSPLLSCNYSGGGSLPCSITSNELTVDLSGVVELSESGGENIQIHGIQLALQANQNVDNVALELDVSGGTHVVDDESDEYIKVGRASLTLDSSGQQRTDYLRSDSNGSCTNSSLQFPDITIVDGSDPGGVPVFGDNGGTFDIVLPDDLEWIDHDSDAACSNFSTLYSCDGCSDGFEITSISLIDNHTLRLGYSGQSDSGNTITISGLFINPINLTSNPGQLQLTVYPNSATLNDDDAHAVSLDLYVGEISLDTVENQVFTVQDGHEPMQPATLAPNTAYQSSWPKLLADRQYALVLPDNIRWGEGGTHILNTGIITSGDLESNDTYIIGGYDFYFDEMQDEGYISLSANDIGIENATSSHSLRVGNPSLAFEQDEEQIFIYQSSSVTLDDIIYQEDSVPSGTSQYGVRIKIPAGPFTFDTSSIPIVTGPGDPTAYFGDNKTLIIPLDSDLNNADALQISGLKIFTEDVGTSTTLELDVNGHLGDDNANQMSGFSSGDPSLTSDGDYHMIILGESDTPLETLTIAESQVATIMPGNNIHLIIPDDIDVLWHDTQSPTFGGDFSNINTTTYSISGSKRMLSFTVDEPFEPDQSMTIGNLRVNALDASPTSTDPHYLELYAQSDITEYDEIPPEYAQTVRLDNHRLIVAAPTLEFSSHNRYVVGDESAPMSTLILRENTNQDYPTIKQDSLITIKLSSDKLEWNHVKNMLSNPEENFIYSEVDPQTLTLTPQNGFSETFEGGNVLNLGWLEVENFTERVDSIALEFAIRGDYNELLLSSSTSDQNQCSISKPDIRSEQRQIFYKDVQDESGIASLYKIIVTDDVDNPVFNRLDPNGALRNELKIIIPDEQLSNMSWLTSSTALLIEGDAWENVDLEISSIDASTATLTFNQAFDPGASFEIVSGLKVNTMSPSSDNTSSSLEFALTDGTDFNYSDMITAIDHRLYVREVGFGSSNGTDHIITKGINPQTLNDIQIVDESGFGNEDIVYVYLPAQLNLEWNDNSCRGVPAEIGSCSYQENRLELSDFDDDTHIYISGLEIENNSTLDDPTASSHLQIVFNGATDQIIEDPNLIYIVSAGFESETDDRILFDPSQSASSSRYPLKNIKVRNDTVLVDQFLIQQGDTLNFVIPEDLSCYWDMQSDNVEVDADFLIRNENLTDDKRLRFDVQNDIGNEFVELSNLHISCDDRGKSHLQMMIERNNDDFYIGQNSEFIAVGTPAVSSDPTQYMIKADNEILLPNIKIDNDSDINILSPGFMVCLYDDAGISDDIKFKSIDEATDENGENLAFEIAIDPDHEQCISITSDIYYSSETISGLKGELKDNIYDEDLTDVENDASLFNHGFRLILEELDEENDDYIASNNYVESIKNIELFKSIFFNIPELRTDESDVSSVYFYVINNHFGNLSKEDINDIQFVLNNGEDIDILALLFDDENYDIDGEYTPPSYDGECSSLESLGLVNEGCNFLYDVSRVRIDLSKIIDELNLTIDKMTIDGDAISLAVQSLVEQDNYDVSNITLYPPGLDINNFTFPDNRALSPEDLGSIPIFSSYVIDNNILMDLEFMHSNSISKLDCSSSKLNCDDESAIYITLNPSNQESGVYSVDIMIQGQSEQKSIPFQRKFLIDKEMPDLKSIYPIPGQTLDGNGHLITNKDNLMITMSDSSVIAEEDSLKHADYETLGIDLTHILFNELYMHTEVDFDSDDEPGEYIYIDEILDTITLESNFEVLYDDIFNHSLDLNENGKIKYTIMVEDQAGNDTTYVQEFYLEMNQGSANDHHFNYKNPFSPTSGEKTHFVYNIINPAINQGTLIVFDASGQIVYLKNLNSNKLTNGTHEIIWDGRTNQGDILSTGVYFSIIDFGITKTRINKVAIIND